MNVQVLFATGHHTKGGADQRAYDPTAVAAAMQFSRFQRVLIEGSRLSSPFTGRVEILNLQRTLLKVSIPQWIGGAVYQAVP